MSAPTSAEAASGSASRGLSLVVLILAVATATLLVERHVKRSSFAALKAETKELQGQLSELRAYTRRLETQLTIQKGVSSVEQAGAKSPVPASAGEKGSVRAEMDGATSPEIERLRTIGEGGKIETAYGALFKRWDLEPVKARELKALLIERQLTLNDIFTTARAQGVNPATAEGRAALAEFANKVNSEYDRQIRATLDPERYADLKTYEQMLPQRNTVAAFAQRLSNTAAPLRAEQTEHLIALISPQAPGEGRSLTAENGIMIARISEPALARAQTILTPEQMKVLTAMRQEQQARLSVAKMRQGESP